MELKISDVVSINEKFKERKKYNFEIVENNEIFATGNVSFKAADLEYSPNILDIWEIKINEMIQELNKLGDTIVEYHKT